MIVQSIILPQLFQPGLADELYVRRRTAGSAHPTLNESLQFNCGETVDFDTFFNSLTVAMWRRHCELMNISLNIFGRGAFNLKFFLRASDAAPLLLQEQQLILSEKGVNVALPFWPQLEQGLLFFSLTALADGAVLKGGAYRTTQPPANDVRLGVVITHFNRRERVLASVARIEAGLLADPYYHEKIELIVVDNSRSIRPDEVGASTLLPNNNYGGAGGFMRGLLHLEQSGRFTHCLFMDDDAACEIESLRRAFALAAFARTKKFTLAGALLNENEPYRLLEKGARFTLRCRPLKSGLDMGDTRSLLAAESSEHPADYGAWWFFCFCLADVESYAFPFFVRGDDIAFSMLNRFHVATMNGVACWGDDFAQKSNPLTAYLDARSHLVNGMIVQDASRRQMIRSMRKFFFQYADAYLYGSAAAVALALDHVLQGPEFWRDNLDLSAVRAQLAPLCLEEQVKEYAGGTLGPGYIQPRLRLFDHIFSLATLRGLLIPSPWLSKDILLFEKGNARVRKFAYRYQRVYYYSAAQSVGFFARQDKRRSLTEAINFIGKLWRLWRTFDALKAEYRAAAPQMTSRQFWCDALLSRRVKSPGAGDGQVAESLHLSSRTARAAANPK